MTTRWSSVVGLLVAISCRNTDAAVNYRYCGEELTVAWWDYPPYAYHGHNGTVEGILPAVLISMLESCCEQRPNISFDTVLDSHADAIDHVTNGTADIVLPVSGLPSKKTFLNLPFIGVLQSPGVVFLISHVGNMGQVILTAVSSSWPLLVLVLVTVAIAGTLFWLFECVLWPKRPNPSPFYKAIPEGVWWAFVTMTTVGYGDIFPRSAPGRVLTAAWIILGTVMCTTFTALVTSILTSVCLAESLTLHGTTIGVVLGSEEYNICVQRNALPIGLDSLEEIAEGMKASHLDGALIDSYVVGHHPELFGLYRIQDILDYKLTYGFVLRPRMMHLQQCLRTYVAERQDEVYRKTSSRVTPLKVSLRSSAEERSSGLINISSRGFVLTVTAIMGVLGVAILLGFAWGHLLKGKTIHRSKMFPLLKDITEVELMKMQHSIEMQTVLKELSRDIIKVRGSCYKAIRNKLESSHAHDIYDPPQEEMYRLDDPLTH